VFVNNFGLANSDKNNENRYSPKSELKQNLGLSPYQSSKAQYPPPAESQSSLRNFTNHLTAHEDKKNYSRSGTNIIPTIASFAYLDSNKSQLPNNFNDYMKSSRQEYTKALRLYRQLNDSSCSIGDPEVYYLPKRYSRNKTLLLDMDETLIHSEEYEPEKGQRSHPRRYDFVIEMNTNGRI